MQILKPSLHSYMFKKFVINFWLVNAVINTGFAGVIVGYFVMVLSLSEYKKASKA